MDAVTNAASGAWTARPGLTDIWAWRPDSAAAPADSDFMRILGGVAGKG